MTLDEKESVDKLYARAFVLAIITVLFNISEGVVATYFGLKDETLTLFGFGMDSFIETISALGILQMVIRIREFPGSGRGKFENSALRITGWCFYVLAMILAISATVNLTEGHVPESTVSGIIIAVISIIAMWVLIRAKMKTGNELNCSPIISDARCNLVCVYMSLVLLLASGIYWLFRVPYIDVLGAAGLIYFSFKEGREAFEKAGRLS
jgi:divalent metal cation (Fe/Co/Zn/Cd) transporter